MIHIIFRVKLRLNTKTSWKESSNIYTTWTVQKIPLKKIMASFYRWGLTASRLEPLWGSSLPFTTKFPEIPGTHFIDLRMMKGWVDLGATLWFWTRDLWIGKIMTQNAEKYLTQEFRWFWPIIAHGLSPLVRIACFNFSRNLFLSFLVMHGLKF